MWQCLLGVNPKGALDFSLWGIPHRQIYTGLEKSILSGDSWTYPDPNVPRHGKRL